MNDHAPPLTPPIASLRMQEKAPFITVWSGETFDGPRTVSRGNRIGYAGERPCDRDAFGVMWRRVSGIMHLTGIGARPLRNDADPIDTVAYTTPGGSWSRQRKP